MSDRTLELTPDIKKYLDSLTPEGVHRVMTQHMEPFMSRWSSGLCRCLVVCGEGKGFTEAMGVFLGPEWNRLNPVSCDYENNKTDAEVIAVNAAIREYLTTHRLAPLPAPEPHDATPEDARV